MTVFLEGVAVRFYRGIGPTVQNVAPFQDMNFFVGSNNSGKSTILNLLSTRFEPAFSDKGAKSLDPVEVYRGKETGQFFIAYGKSKQKVLHLVVEMIKKNAGGNHYYANRAIPAVEQIVDAVSLDGHVWVTRKSGNYEIHPPVFPEEVERQSDNWQEVWTLLTGMTGGSRKHNWIPDTVSHIARLAAPAVPSIHIIPAKRQLGEKGDSFTDLSGRGLIDHLATLQNPSFDKQSDRERFQRINAFLREITGKPDALLEVPSEREHLLVHMDNKVLPLSSLGTGVHEVILIAAFCTIYDNNIMCIEEPEIHLHPTLQRKLVRYLREKTSNQYFIATHSSAFIDSRGASIFHVTNDGVQTHIKPALTLNGQREILDDLGCHASDILQTNAVIWVEGPSDRIYLKHWMAAVDPALVEGIHYTIMFYGGGLIKHLAASDEALSDFIKLRDLNRNMAIVIDSDRTVESDELKPHARRLSEEMGQGAGIAWVTAGREVENYVDGTTLQAALKELHPRLYKEAGKTGRYDHAFYFWRDDPDNPGRRKTYTDGDKVGAANIICSEPAQLDVLDLRERVTEIVGMVRKANGLI